ncbi:HAL/PAL/TAL family ammonia-lyase [Sphingomonas sp. PAMC 26617]|uniref:HAL/PAL/TAL family ammonia-lyase n=1 Tax=Sphingomonas sp. PAMC 26617 TaxID=1112216 RepID=UPI000287EACE|nr:aromatic amino acid ammonia-lyase [Sphingomonas sp. PAMC 26617]
MAMLDLRSEAASRSVIVGDLARPVALDDVEAVATGAARVELHPDTLRRAAASDALITRLVAERRAIYGVTTGYGPLANNHVDPAQGALLQRKLVYHLASGVGAPLPPAQARAIVMARLVTLSQGLSAVRPELLEWLCACLNCGLAPIIPEKGTVGASGDLTPLAHMALAFMGEGAFWQGGASAPADAMLQAAGLRPVTLRHKEGLALVNGTSAMTGIATLNGVRARRLLRLSALLTVAYAEALGGHRAAWHSLGAVARPHAGQRRATALLWGLTENAPRLRQFAPIPARIAPAGDDGVAHTQELPQDAYSIRCAPQLLGAVDDMLVHHDRIVEIELSSVTDNPLVFAEEDTILHAGNFFGQHVSFASDSLNNAIIMLGVWSERQIARLTDATLNSGLPPFLQGNATGLNSGFMGAQVTASALVAELRAKSAPASIQSMPTNANNQDVVTMGTVAARRAGESLTDVSRILAIQAMCVAQAVELRRREDDRPFSVAAEELHFAVRHHSAFLNEDRPLSHDIETIAIDLLTGAMMGRIGRRSNELRERLEAF